MANEADCSAIWSYSGCNAVLGVYSLTLLEWFYFVISVFASFSFYVQHLAAAFILEMPHITPNWGIFNTGYKNLHHLCAMV